MRHYFGFFGKIVFGFYDWLMPKRFQRESHTMVLALTGILLGLGMPVALIYFIIRLLT
ncbi:MAG: hypothetical protein Q7S28_00440 [bacterium]|nr:hypothetical protein [bacterium]